MVKKPIVEVGERVPKTFKFGIIVAVALLWAQFFKGLLVELLEVNFNSHSEIAVDLIVAVIATLVGWLILMTYTKIKSRLRKVKVET